MTNETKLPDEDGLLEAMARAIVYAHRLDLGEEHEDAHRASDNEWPDFLPEARAALDAIRPTLAALQTHAEFLERDGQILQKERNEWREAMRKDAAKTLNQNDQPPQTPSTVPSSSCWCSSGPYCGNAGCYRRTQTTQRW